MPSPSPDAWAQIRYDYEHTDRMVVDICLEHGITPNTLHDRRRRWGWRQRRPAIPQEGPPAVAVPRIDVAMPSLDGFSQSGAAAIQTPTPTLPLSGGGSSEVAERGSSDVEPSPHLVPPLRAADDTRPIGERLHSAVARVMPAIETTLATLAAGPARPREMELATRALGSLMRTLRELNGLLAQHQTAPGDGDPPPENIDEFRNELARRIEALIASHEAQIPAKYEAAWQEFAAETGAPERLPAT